MKWVLQKLKNWGSEKNGKEWSRKHPEVDGDCSDLENGSLWGADRPRRKNRPGAFTKSEKVELVEFGTQCIFHIPLSFWVCTGSPGRMYLFVKDWCLPLSYPHPAQCPVQAYWLTCFWSLSVTTIFFMGEGDDKMCSSKLFKSIQGN